MKSYKKWRILEGNLKIFQNYVSKNMSLDKLNKKI